jgi:butyryl-CoA dehydrogenase
MGTTLAASTLAMESVAIAGNDDQKRRFFAAILKSGAGAFGLTEPGAGLDVTAGQATAVQEGGDYVPNGVKCWIINASFASVHLIFAQTDPTKGAKGLSALIVEQGQVILARLGNKLLVGGCEVEDGLFPALRCDRGPHRGN